MIHRFSLIALTLPLFACSSTSTLPVEQGTNFEVIPLKHAHAPEVASVLQRAFHGPIAPAARVVSDHRTNSLLVLAEAPELKGVRDLILALDRPVPGDEED